MKIACISSSNTKLMGDKSASTQVCSLIKDIINRDYDTNAEVNIVPLVNYDLKPCILCGNCCKTGRCIYDDDFNYIFSQMAGADAVFYVVPHYSPIPSKLLIMFEKMNEIAYSGWLNNPGYKFSLRGKPAGIIGHGGMVENAEVLKYYHDSLITPAANTLKSLSFNVISYSKVYPNGAPFGLMDDKCLKKVENSIFPEIIQDYALIENRIKPLVENVINSIKAKG